MQMKHFQLYELVSQNQYYELGEKAWDLFDPEALKALDDLEDFLKRPIVVNNWHALKPGAPPDQILQWCGARTLEKAKELGATGSQHVADLASGRLCRAFDCHIHGMTAEAARQMILANKDNPLLRRIMRLEGGVNWVHFDLKPTMERIYVFKK